MPSRWPSVCPRRPSALLSIDIDQIPVSDYPMYWMSRGLMVQRACDFTIICFLARLQIMGRGIGSFLLEIGKLIWNCQIAWKTTLLPFLSKKNGWKTFVFLCSDKIWGFGHFQDEQDLPLQISWKVTQILFDFPSWRERKNFEILLLLLFNVLLMRLFCMAGKLDCKYCSISPCLFVQLFQLWSSVL